MRDEFPPKPQQHTEIAAALAAFGSVMHGRAATYVSSPLTTGQRAFEWHQQNGSADATSEAGSEAMFRDDVIAGNRQQAARYVERLRRRRAIVIDPTALADLPGWTQSDYRFFWGRVIEEYAETVVFRRGWEYSSGCAYEFLVATRSGRESLDEELNPLTVQKGR
jgi:hypothetical protein